MIYKCCVCFFLLFIISISCSFTNIYIIKSLKYKNNISNNNLVYEGSDYNLEKCKKINNYRLLTYDNFLTKKECNYIIKISKNKLNRSTVIGKQDTITNDRTSTQTWFQREDDPIFEKISDKVSKICNYPVENQESIQVLHYEPGQHYKPHYDACIDGSEECKNDANNNGGHRVCTFLIYLNDVAEGGETSFPNYYGLKIKPKTGKAVYFDNLDKTQTERHPCSLHWANKPKNNCEKWAMNIWVRQKKNKQ